MTTAFEDALARYAQAVRETQQEIDTPIIRLAESNARVAVAQAEEEAQRLAIVEMAESR